MSELENASREDCVKEVKQPIAKDFSLDQIAEALGCEAIEDSPPGVAGAAVRSIEVWIRAHESKLTREVVEDLKGEVDRLKAELKGKPAMRVAP